MLNMSKVRIFKDLKKMFKSSIRQKLFLRVNWVKIFNFFMGCYFLENFGWNSREGPEASDKLAHFHKFEHLCKISTNEECACFKPLRCYNYHGNKFKSANNSTIVGILTFMSRIFRAQLS